eukprot:TRINITY_DN65511_c0_g1_i1.p1 TRINITY_DN65511_c0_g1~~TRINITY_DN65511_c0_g1_i1.p1  ORF type:complete len:310 (+),score=54.46 TRINITY_DN65511_c0_g1_i1:84-932(+)
MESLSSLLPAATTSGYTLASRVEESASKLTGSSAALSGAREMLDQTMQVAGNSTTAKMASSLGSAYISSMVPGGSLLLNHIGDVGRIARSDVPGGLSLGDELSLERLAKPGLRGFRVSSRPDGAEYYLGEETSAWHCCCFTCGPQLLGPAFTLVEGNPISGKEVLRLQSRIGCCGLGHHVVEALAPDGSSAASAVEDQGFCCCWRVNMHVNVRDIEKYTLSGSHCCCAGGVELNLEAEPTGDVVGTVGRLPGHINVKFPSGAYSSEKAGILGAALLTDLRLR